eukprot:649682-Pelagomonas_calceolata.AAC.3
MLLQRGKTRASRLTHFSASSSGGLFVQLAVVHYRVVPLDQSISLFYNLLQQAPGGSLLWVNKYAPQSFMSLLSDEQTNRCVASVKTASARPQNLRVRTCDSSGAGQAVREG